MDKQIEQMKVHGSINDLMSYVRIHGIATGDQETLNKMADIVGNAPISELETIANKDQNQFYFLLRYIWPMIDIIRFYNDHSNKELQSLRSQSDTDGDTIIDLNRQIAALSESLKTSQALLQRRDAALQTERMERDQIINNHNTISDELYNTKQIIINQQQEINALKAKMYDMINK
jgi:hypothetical protein